VPDGALSLLPLAALPAGEGRYLLEEAPPLHYLTAERDLTMLPATDTERGRGLLALGGATFEASALGPGPVVAFAGDAGVPADFRVASLSCSGMQNHRFELLGGTLDEVQDLSRIWSAAPGRSAARVLTGEAATERAVKSEARSHQVLHLATHGFFLNESCNGRPGDAPKEGMRGVGGLSSSGATENPLRLSGLALAGANHRAQAKPDEDDGILTAEEVAMLDLHGVEWAVLSACDTGVGEIRAGEGVFGLRRAFQVAGARTVIMSLWSVEDQATRAWMRALYEGRFQKGLSTADAVHQASLTVLRDRRARGQSTLPFFWAAFVAAGDWR
jgi:CHAT domain-containing protein